MKTLGHFILLLSASLAMQASAITTYHVSDSSGNDTNSGLSWAEAKQTIQAAVNAASSNDIVLVTNGVYQTGGFVVNYDADWISNRVYIAKPLTLQSVNGPEVTIIQGFQDVGSGYNSVRCLRVQPNIGATITGFTLTGGGTETSTEDERAAGGGAYQFTNSSPRATLNNCIISGNRAWAYGGGVYGFILNNCVVSSNAVRESGTRFGGGGAYGSILNYCTLSGNSTPTNIVVVGGGVHGGTLNNCIVASNSAYQGGGAYVSELNNCLVVGNSAYGAYGGGAISSIVRNCTVVENYSGERAAVYKCTNYNSIILFNSSGGSANYPDFGNPVSDGDNWWLENCYGQGIFPNFPGVGTNNVTPGSADTTYGFVSPTNGDYRLLLTSKAINAGNNAYAPGSTDLDGNPRIDATVVDIGAYEINLTTDNLWHVSTNGNDAADGLSWAQAKRTIQAAVDDAVIYGTVIVSNGVYDTGGKVLPPAGSAIFYLTNRVAIAKPLTVRSVNGPMVTTIQGFRDTTSSNGAASVRCVGMAYTDTITLEGFTLADGGTLSQKVGGTELDLRGGGVFRVQEGLKDLLFEINYPPSLILNCILRNNHARLEGGGAYGEIGSSTNVGKRLLLRNCVLWGNSAGDKGGAASADLENCTVWGNSASNGAGVFGSKLNNCIVYANTNTAGAVDNYGNSVTFSNSCTTPLPPGPGNFTNDPLFVDALSGNFQLQAGSPARDTGNNDAAPSGPDLAGNPRIVHGYVDVGAYEYQGGAGQADYDGDGMGNGDEQVAGTDLTDTGDVFEIGALTFNSPATLTFDTVSGRVYAVDYNEDLLPTPQQWFEFTNNIPGTGQSIEIQDPGSATSRSYRVRVQRAP